MTQAHHLQSLLLDLSTKSHYIPSHTSKKCRVDCNLCSDEMFASVRHEEQNQATALAPPKGQRGEGGRENDERSLPASLLLYRAFCAVQF